MKRLDLYSRFLIGLILISLACGISILSQAQSSIFDPNTTVAGMSIVVGPKSTVLSIAGCCVIHGDGNVEIKDTASLNEASRKFWNAVSNMGMANCKPAEPNKP